MRSALVMSSTVTTPWAAGFSVIQGSIRIVFPPDSSLKADWPQNVTVTSPVPAYAAENKNIVKTAIVANIEITLFMSTFSFFFKIKAGQELKLQFHESH